MPVGVVDVPEEIEVGHDHGHRTLEALGAGELLAEDRGEVPGVEEAGLRIDPSFLLECRHAERAVDEEESATANTISQGLTCQKAATTTPRQARTASVVSDSNVKIESGLCPRARCSMIANPSWLTSTKTRAARAPVRARESRGSPIGEWPEKKSTAPQVAMTATVKFRMLNVWMYQGYRVLSQSGICDTSTSRATNSGGRRSAPAT